MIKEKLTIDDIKKDLRVEIKDGYMRLAVFSGSFLFMFAIFLWIVNMNIFFTAYKIMFGFGSVLMIICLVSQISDLIILHRNLKNKKCIVIDKLISAEVHDDIYGKAYARTYQLNFSGYGEFVIHAENYKWSKLFSMDDHGVYTYADSGDEFYLVLSKPHTGKILLAYNTKMFEME